MVLIRFCTSPERCVFSFDSDLNWSKRDFHIIQIHISAASGSIIILYRNSIFSSCKFKLLANRVPCVPVIGIGHIQISDIFAIHINRQGFSITRSIRITERCIIHSGICNFCIECNCCAICGQVIDETRTRIPGVVHCGRCLCIKIAAGKGCVFCFKELRSCGDRCISTYRKIERSI